MRAHAVWQTSDRRQACGANHHGGGGLGQPPADAIEASALRARPRWRGAPRLVGEPRKLVLRSRRAFYLVRSSARLVNLSPNGRRMTGVALSVRCCCSGRLRGAKARNPDLSQIPQSTINSSPRCRVAPFIYRLFLRQRFHSPKTSSIFSGNVARLGRFQSLDWEMSDPIFWEASSEPEHDPSSFAVGGKGLASAAGAANARNNCVASQAV